MKHRFCTFTAIAAMLISGCSMQKYDSPIQVGWCFKESRQKQNIIFRLGFPWWTDLGYGSKICGLDISPLFVLEQHGTLNGLGISCVSVRQQINGIIAAPIISGVAELNGLSFSYANLAFGFSRGAQIGIFNIADFDLSTMAIQIGLLNGSKQSYFQLGLYNEADCGFQIGLLNRNRNALFFEFFPLINLPSHWGWLEKRYDGDEDSRKHPQEEQQKKKIEAPSELIPPTTDLTLTEYEADIRYHEAILRDDDTAFQFLLNHKIPIPKIIMTVPQYHICEGILREHTDDWKLIRRQQQLIELDRRHAAAFQLVNGKKPEELSIKDRMELLEIAVRNGPSDTVRLLLDTGCIATPDLTHIAVSAHNLAAAELLISKGAVCPESDLNELKNMRSNPLEYLPKKNTLSRLENAMNAGIGPDDPKILADSGKTPPILDLLHRIELASRKEEKAHLYVLLNYLIRHGAREGLPEAEQKGIQLNDGNIENIVSWAFCDFEDVKALLIKGPTDKKSSR